MLAVWVQFFAYSCIAQLLKDNAYFSNPFPSTDIQLSITAILFLLAGQVIILLLSNDCIYCIQQLLFQYYFTRSATFILICFFHGSYLFIHIVNSLLFDLF